MEVISFSSRTRFGSDFLWNLASLGILALSGIGINVIIGQWGGPHDLGVFNQVFAFFIFVSQLCVGGLHLSVLKELSYASQAEGSPSEISTTAIILAFVVSAVVTGCFLPLSGPIGRALQSPAVSFGLLLAMPGVIFFAVNKVLLNILNGLRFMRAHAVYQALRYLLLVGVISGMLLFDVDGAWLPLALTLTEVTLTTLLLPYIHMHVVPLRVSGWSSLQPWFRTHLSFGSRGALCGFLTELNTRIDILVLGFFYDDRLVGIYSFGAAFAEGFAQLPFIVRRNLDPLFGTYLARGDLSAVQETIDRTRQQFLPAMLLLGTCSAIGYALMVPYLPLNSDFQKSVAVYGILAASIMFAAGVRPFGGLLLQAGKPGLYTIIILSSVIANIVLAAFLAPLLAHIGCAIAYGVAILVESVLIVRISRAYLSIRV